MITGDRSETDGGLSPRLRAVLDLFPAVHTAADIGADHGKLAGALLMSGKAVRVIATDISAASLAKTRRLYEHNAAVEYRLGDGLHPLKEGEASAAAIAGIGGLQIARILQSCEQTARGMTFVLQPMQKISALRAFIRQNDYTIANEAMAMDRGRYYAVLRVTNGKETSRLAPEIYDEAGPVLFAAREQLQLLNLQNQLRTLRVKREQFGGGEELQSKIALLMRVISEWEKR